MSTTSAPLLSIQGLEKAYPNGFQALRGIDLDIEAGEFVVIIGLSGAGKSTFIRCINRLIDPTGGTIRFDGHDVTTCRGAELRALRRDMAMIFQQFNLVKRATVETNVLTGALERASTLTSLLGFWPRAEREAARGYLELVGLPGEIRRRADALSGGQQQRVAIARALMQRPKMILADEPVASLDPATSHSVMKYLKQLQEDGLTIVANLHFLSLAREYGTRVVALKDGRKVFDGPPTEITDAKFQEIYGEDAMEVEIR
ncbi:MAG: phosphonate ABC transporter ATP-binding protein [Planctomycetota bacterium]|nr:phosphonate ABC transporter ATP-binding protein [Planctomycetota bacterium]